MALTRELKLTVVNRVQRDPAFATSLLEEAATLFLNGYTENTRLIFRSLMDATGGCK